jgi:hypothetical protein
MRHRPAGARAAINVAGNTRHKGEAGRSVVGEFEGVLDPQGGGDGWPGYLVLLIKNVSIKGYTNVSSSRMHRVRDTPKLLMRGYHEFTQVRIPCKYSVFKSIGKLLLDVGPERELLLCDIRISRSVERTLAQHHRMYDMITRTHPLGACRSGWDEDLSTNSAWMRKTNDRRSSDAKLLSFTLLNLNILLTSMPKRMGMMSAATSSSPHTRPRPRTSKLTPSVLKGERHARNSHASSRRRAGSGFARRRASFRVDLRGGCIITLGRGRRRRDKPIPTL